MAQDNLPDYRLSLEVEQGGSGCGQSLNLRSSLPWPVETLGTSRTTIRNITHILIRNIAHADSNIAHANGRKALVAFGTLDP